MPIDEHVHPSDRARILRTAGRRVEPGSVEEAIALQAIDDARCDLDDEISGRADKRRRRAHQRYWQDRGAHVA